MPLYELAAGRLKPLNETSFGTEGLRERRDLPRLLRDQIEVIAPDPYVIAEECGDWTDSRWRIDYCASTETPTSSWRPRSDNR